MKTKPPSRSGGPGEQGAVVLSFPTRRQTEHLSGREVLDKLSEIGVTISVELLRFLRFRRMIQGIHGKHEFFDVLSTQPFPFRQEDSPSYCYDHGLPRPDWIKTRYISVEDQGEKKILVYVDVPRNLFLKEDLSDQDHITALIYAKVIGV